MAKVKVVLDRGAVREKLLKGAETKAMIKRYGEAAYAKVSDVEGYVLEDRNYPERCGAAIYAKEPKAIYDNLENNTLLKAVK